MSNFFFNTPLWFPLLLAAIGVYVFWTGNNRQENRVRLAGIGLLLAAVAVCLLSYFVDTPTEKCVKQSKALIYSVNQRDWTGMRQILDPNTSVSVGVGLHIYENRDEIVSGARHAVDQYGLQNVQILSTVPEESQSMIAVTMRVISEQNFTQGRPISTDWSLEWQRRGKDWALLRINCINIAGQTGDNAGRHFPRP